MKKSRAWFVTIIIGTVACVFVSVLSSNAPQGTQQESLGTALAVATELKIINLSNYTFASNSQLVGGSGITILGCPTGIYTIQVISPSTNLVVNHQDVYVGMAQEVVVTIHENGTITGAVTDHYKEIMQKFFPNFER